tara:strand:- start:1387 stop:1599 length:213 start_codon:yes stop_codon:yes gene_type:complete
LFSFRSEQIPGKPKGSGDFYFDSVSQTRLDSWNQGRVALIGDAASCTSFLAGEGTGMVICWAMKTNCVVT